MTASVHEWNWKGELLTFCQHSFCSAPKYKSEQLLSLEWRSECTVECPYELITSPTNDSKYCVTTKSTTHKKKKSEAEAAEQMIDKLKKMLEPFEIKLKQLRKQKTQKEILSVVESLFTDEYINDSTFMRQWIQSNPEQWIPIHDIMNMSMLNSEFGEKSWNNDQCSRLKQVFIEMIQIKSKTLEVSNDEQYIRRKKQIDDICTKNQIRSEELKLNGNQLFADKKFQDAIKCYLDALKYDQSDYKIAMNLSLTYLKAKDLDSALKYANIAIQQQPKYAKPYARAAAVLFEMHMPKQAIATMDHAIRNTKMQNKQYIEC
eukprot:201994_1